MSENPIAAAKGPKRPQRGHRRQKSNIEKNIRHVRVNSKLAFYEKFNGSVSPRIAAAERKKGRVKRNFIIRRRRKKTASELRDPVRARCPFYARVLYDFEGEQDDEITCKKNTLLCITIVSPTKWCLGQDGEGNEGWIPISYIERVHPKLDTELAAEAARQELKGVQMRIDKIQEALKRGGTKEEMEKLNQELRDLLRRKDLASRRAKAYESASRAMSSQAKAKAVLDKAKANGIADEKVNKAKQWLMDAEQSVKEALEMLSSNKGLAAAIEAVKCAEKAAAKAELEAEAAVKAGASEQEVNAFLIPARQRLLRAKHAVRTLQLYEKALAERQDAALLILKHHEGDSGIDFKLQIAKRNDANERAVLLKLAAERAVEELGEEEKAAMLRPLVKELKNRHQQNPSDKATEAEYKQAKQDLATAEKRSAAAGALRLALENQAIALEKVQTLARSGSASVVEMKKAKENLEKCKKETEKALANYKKVFGKDPLTELNSLENGSALAKLEEMLSQAAIQAPVRPADTAYSTDHKRILEAVETSSILNEARLKAPVEVYLPDLEGVLVAGNRDAQMAAAIIGYIDAQHMSLKDFAAIALEVEKEAKKWEHEKNLVKGIFKKLHNWGVTEKQLDVIFNRSLAGSSMARYLKEEPGSWVATVESTVEYLLGRVEKERERVADAREMCMQVVQQLLSGRAYTVHMREFRQLFRSEDTADMVLKKLKKLQEEKKEFSRFDQIFAAVTNKTPEAPKHARSESDQQGVKHRVLRYITDPNCLLFNSATLKVQASVMRDLNSAYPDPVQVTIDLAVTQAAGQSFPSFLALATALREQTAKSHRESYEKIIQSIPALKGQGDSPGFILGKLAEISPHRLRGLMRILGSLQLKGSAGEAIVEIKKTVTSLKGREEKEVCKVVDFLSTQSIFMVKTSVRKPQLLNLVRLSLFSNHGLQGKSISEILNKLVKKDTVFDSFGSLVNAVDLKVRFPS
ncbi:hypothetical protein AAMO2058_001015300 [Amorphochlora amoebiformis]